jgi:CRP-like cAMP-binding protein
MPERRARGRLPKIDPLPPDIARAIYDMGIPVHVPTGGALYHQGEAAEHVYVVSAGYVKMTSTSATGHQVVVAFLGPLYTLGLAALAIPPVYIFNALAATPVTAYRRTRAQAERMRLHPSFRHYLDQLAYHYTEILATRLHSLSEGPLAERVAASLLELAVMHGTPADHGGMVDIEPPVTFEDLGGLAGTTVEAISRYTMQWREAGAVLPRIGKRRISLYPERLRDVVWRSGPLLSDNGRGDRT